MKKTVMKKILVRRLLRAMYAVGVFGITTNAIASGYQLWEQDAGSGLGNYHAGRAAIAEDASTAFYNPAGLVRIQNQQGIVGANNIMTDFRYSGTASVNNIFGGAMPTSAQGGTYNFVPFGHYAAPLSEKVVFGLSAVVPFGLRTDWGRNSPLRYMATLSSLNVVDVAPSLGIAVTDKFSFGVGFDAERAQGKFGFVAGAIAPGVNDTDANNDGTSTAYGYHAGVLYQFSPGTRAGLSYQSKIVHHLRGTSLFVGPIAEAYAGMPELESDHFRVNVPLPAVSSFSVFHAVNTVWM